MTHSQWISVFTVIALAVVVGGAILACVLICLTDGFADKDAER